MTPDNPLQDFYLLAHSAMRAEREFLSTTDAEPAYSALLDFALARPEMRPALAQAFVKLSGELGPGDWLAYCMHALRWSEVRNHIVAWSNTNTDRRAQPVIAYVIKA